MFPPTPLNVINTSPRLRSAAASVGGFRTVVKLSEKKTQKKPQDTPLPKLCKYRISRIPADHNRNYALINFNGGFFGYSEAAKTNTKLNDARVFTDATAASFI